MIDEHGINDNRTSSFDTPISVPHCSDAPGLNVLWESEDTLYANDYTLRSPRQWTANVNQSDLVAPVCNKFRVACHTINYDLLVLVDTNDQYTASIQTLLEIFLALLEPADHRLSFMVLSSATVDVFQYHLPLTSVNSITGRIVRNYLLYSGHDNSSVMPLNQHIQRASEYLTNNQRASSKSPAQQMVLTISSRLNFNRHEMERVIQRYSTIRYMALDPHLKDDDDLLDDQERQKLLVALTSAPWYANAFWSYAANRDLTFSTVFRILESMCGYLR